MATESAIATNLSELQSAGIYTEHLDKDALLRISNLPPEEVRLLVELKARFTGAIPAEPAMYEGSAGF